MKRRDFLRAAAGALFSAAAPLPALTDGVGPILESVGKWSEDYIDMRAKPLTRKAITDLFDQILAAPFYAPTAPMYWTPTRTCECGEKTDQPGLCDGCTGDLRTFCPRCGRRDLIPRLEHGFEMTPRHKTPSGSWCPEPRYELEIMN